MHEIINRKEGNDQKLVQLLNTLHPRHQSERRTHLKQQHHNQNTTSRKPKDSFFSNICICKVCFSGQKNHHFAGCPGSDKWCVFCRMYSTQNIRIPLL